ncbi:MAG TPA: molecular chaperone HtpG, partial [Porphyromonadaceae bacterium]|nr:molecular chaperone HtpG [Porphyromonadaceae bacterium]
KLEEIFKKERTQLEEKWDSLKIFVEYGMLTEERFYDRASKFALLKNTDNKYFTLDEYKALTESSQTDKNSTLVYLYANNKEDQYTFIDAAKGKGYDVLMMDGQLDVHWLGLLEQKLEKTRFVRVDSDTVEHIIEKDEKTSVELSDKEKENLTEAIQSLLPNIDKTEFNVDFKSLGETTRPVQITQNEFSRRMKEMSAMQPGMAFYGEMPDMFQVIVNMDHPIAKQLLGEVKDKSKEETTAFASENARLKQVIDLALLSNGMLRGEALSNFIKRSVELL